MDSILFSTLYDLGCVTVGVRVMAAESIGFASGQPRHRPSAAEVDVVGLLLI